MAPLASTPSVIVTLGVGYRPDSAHTQFRQQKMPTENNMRTRACELKVKDDNLRKISYKLFVTHHVNFLVTRFVSKGTQHELGTHVPT
jgi:hypothetical protein